MQLPDVGVQDIAGLGMFFLPFPLQDGRFARQSVPEQAGGVAAQILVGNGLQGYHVKVLRHSVAGDAGSGKLGGLLDIVACPGGDAVEYNLLCSTAAAEGGYLVLQFFLAEQVLITLIHLHGIT